MLTCVSFYLLCTVLLKHFLSYCSNPELNIWWSALYSRQSDATFCGVCITINNYKNSVKTKLKVCLSIKSLILCIKSITCHTFSFVKFDSKALAFVPEVICTTSCSCCLLMFSQLKTCYKLALCRSHACNMSAVAA